MSTIKRIIKEEILIMANELCDKLIKEDDFHDISSGFFEDVCPNCGEIAFQGIEECSFCKQSLINIDLESQPVEIMQWYIITDWLRGKLEQENEPVVEYLGLSFWGRTGCGYSLEDEQCLMDIADKIDARK